MSMRIASQPRSSQPHGQQPQQQQPQRVGASRPGSTGHALNSASPLAHTVSPVADPVVLESKSPSSSGCGGVSSPLLSEKFQPPSSPVARFAGSATLHALTQQPPAMIFQPVPVQAGASKFQVIQRPLASKSRVGQNSFQHSIHPTAVQASHAVGQHGKMAVSGGGQGIASNSASNFGDQKLPRAGVSPLAVLSSSPSSSSTSTVGGGGAGKMRGSANAGSKDWYGTFPRLGSAGPRVASPADVPSPIRASPHGRSPQHYEELHFSAQASPSTLHPRPKTGAAKAIVRTPPHSGPNSRKKNSYASAARRNSSDQHSSDGGAVTMQELGGSMQDMDITDETPNSGYNSDASAISIDSHASSFPYPADVTYSIVDPQHQDEDAELADVSEVPPNYRGGFPASPMHIRAGAPHPMKMYGLPTTPQRAAMTPAVTVSSATTGASHANTGGSGNSSVRSHSRVEMNSSGESSALQSPAMYPEAASDKAASKLAGGNLLGLHSTAHSGGHHTLNIPMSPIPSIDSGLFETKDHPILVFPLGGFPQAAQQQQGPFTPTQQPRQLTTVPALNLPRSAAQSAAAPQAARSPTGAEAIAAALAAAQGQAGAGVNVGQMAVGAAPNSAFSSARSNSSSAMEWQSTTGQSTTRSLSGGGSLYSQSASNASSLTNLHASNSGHGTER